MAGLKLVAELGGDGSGFDRMMTRAGMTAKNFGGSVISPLKNLIAGAFTIGAISSLTRGTIEWASKLRDVADGLGVNVEWLQRMQNGAKLVGADIEDVSKFINEMNRARQDALQNPTGKNAGALGRLGASPGDIQNLSTMDFFEKIIKAFKGGATTQLVNDVQEVGGRSARNLIAAFSSQFANDIPVLSEQLIDQLDDIGDEFTILAARLKLEFAPAIAAAGEIIIATINKIKQSQAFLGGFLGGGGGVSDKAPGSVGWFGRAVNGRDNLEKLFNEGASAMQEEAVRQREDSESNKAAKENARAARAKRENSSPQFDELAITPKAGKGASPDSLVKIGNFLGSAPNAVNAIAEKHLQTANKQLMTAEEGNKLLRQLLTKFGTSQVGGMSIPAN